MSIPPAWHPNAELKADHLIGLEEYVFSRVSLAEDSAHGVDGVADWRKSISAQGKADRRIVVRDLKGVTPGGHVVVLGTGDSLEASVDLIPSECFDLGLLLNDRVPGAAKYLLHVDRPPSVATPVSAGLTVPNCLYLGRYAVPTTGDPEVLERIHWPVPRRFCGIGPVTDAGWTEWVGPLRDKIEELLRSYSGTGSASAGELATLRYEWPFLTIPALTRRLRMVSWMLRREANPNEQPDIAVGLRGLDLPDATGDLLPLELSKLLGGVTRTAMGLRVSFETLIARLSGFQVAYHAPIGLLRQWTEDLSVGRSSLSEANRDAIAKVAERALDKGEWAAAAARITGAVLGLSVGGGNANDGAMKALELTFVKAKSSSAGPMAFYWMARAACEIPGFAGSCRFPLNIYVSKLQGRAIRKKKTAGSTGKPLAARGSVSSFLTRIGGKILPLENIAPFPWRDKSGGGIARQDSLRIVVAGAPGSGKTALVDALLASGGEIPVSGPGGVLKGRVSFGGRVALATCIEVDPSLPNTGRSEATVHADVLILTVEPRQLDSWRSYELLEMARAIRQYRPEVMIALAFTKADEYGVVDPESLRFINEDGHASIFSSWLRKRNDLAWNKFIGGAETLKRHEREGRSEGKGYIIIDKKVETYGRSTETRKHILTTTAELWSDPAIGAADGFLNGYFVAAVPRDPYLAPEGHRGVLHLLADILGS